MSTEKIKVLRIINRFNLGGPTYNAAYLSKYLDDRFETLLLGGSKDDSEASSEYILDELDLKPTIISQMHRSISLKDIKAYQEIRQIIKDFKPDVVHTHASKAGTLGRLAAIHEGVEVVVHTFHGHVFHSYFGRLKTLFYKTIERWLAARSTAIVAISKQQKHELGTIHKICSPEKISIVPLGFDLSRFSENTQSKRDDFRAKYKMNEGDIGIVIVGRLVPIKNHSMFLDVAKKLIDKGNQNVRFFIVGDGESKEDIQSAASMRNISFTNIDPPTKEAPLCFTSWIKNVDWVYAGCDIVCLTSLNEGTPVSLIEAQSASKPVISTKVGGVEDIVMDGKSAFLVDVNNVDAMTESIQQLIDNPDLRADFGRLGKKSVLEKHSYQRLVEDVSQLYTTLLSQKNNQIEE